MAGIGGSCDWNQQIWSQPSNRLLGTFCWLIAGFRVLDAVASLLPVSVYALCVVACECTHSVCCLCTTQCVVYVGRCNGTRWLLLWMYTVFFASACSYIVCTVILHVDTIASLCCQCVCTMFTMHIVCLMHTIASYVWLAIVLIISSVFVHACEF